MHYGTQVLNEKRIPYEEIKPSLEARIDDAMPYFWAFVLLFALFYVKSL